jgi:hypothetical protein
MLSADAGRASIGNAKVTPKLALYFGTRAIYRGFSQLEMAGRLVRFVRNHGLRFKSDFIRLNAGAVTIDGSGVLLLGANDHRIAAVTAHLVARGGALLGDDAVLWDPVDRTVQPTALPITLQADFGHEAFPDLVAAPRRRRVREGDIVPQVWPVPIDPAELGGRYAEQPAAIRRVYLVQVVDQGPATNRPLGVAEAVFRASASVANIGIWGERALIALRELFEAAPVSAITTERPSDAADAILGALADEGIPA